MGKKKEKLIKDHNHLEIRRENQLEKEKVSIESITVRNLYMAIEKTIKELKLNSK